MMPVMRVRWVAGVVGLTVAALALAGCTGEPTASLSVGATSATPGVDTPLDPSEVPQAETTAPAVIANEPDRQDSVLDSLPGDAQEGCTAVGDQRDVRSGTMAAGNFADARTQFAGSPESPVPFYFIPVDLTGEPPLTVTLSRLDGEGSAQAETSGFQTADEWRYYMVSVVIPSAGQWKIEAGAGDANQGCWEVSFE